MEKFEEVFNRHIGSKSVPISYSNDRLLQGRTFYEQKLWLALRISRVWNDIFSLYGWKRTEGKEKSRQINFFHREASAAVEVQNNWKTLNYDAKQSKFKTLKEFKEKNPEYEVVFGCINDFKERDYYNKHGVRVLTGDAFLQYMLGEDWKRIEACLRELLNQYLQCRN